MTTGAHAQLLASPSQSEGFITVNPNGYQFAPAAESPVRNSTYGAPVVLYQGTPAAAPQPPPTNQLSSDPLQEKRLRLRHSENA